MRYKVEKECKPCPRCNNTGWELITDCHCDGSKFQREGFKELMKYWKEYYDGKVKLRVLIKKGSTWKLSK